MGTSVEMTGTDGTSRITGFGVGRDVGFSLGFRVLGVRVGRLEGFFDGSFAGCLVVGR